jgi:L-lactate dehydrogenase complex protein LldG
VPAGETPADVSVARDYRRHDERGADALVELLCARIVDYGATASVVGEADVARAVGHACTEAGLRRLGFATGLPGEWRPADIELVAGERLSPAEIDRLDGALTGCAVAIAETGTLVLDGGPLSGRRALTLIPDHHLCVVRASQIVGSVPEAVAAVRAAVVDTGAPITFVSGGSASSDIELDRVEGVHGPRQLRVFVVDG